MLKSYVFEKDYPSFVEKTSEYKDGFHVVYDFFHIPVIDAMIIFRAGVKGDVSSFLFFCFIGEKDNEKGFGTGKEGFRRKPLFQFRRRKGDGACLGKALGKFFRKMDTAGAAGCKAQGSCRIQK